MHGPLAIVDGFQADLLAHQGFAHLDALTLPFDLAAGTHFALLPILRVTSWLGQSFRIFPSRRSIHAGGGLLTQGFMRSFFVVFLPEAIKALLLFFEGALGRLRGSLLERAMHALMTAVLLWG